MTGRPSLRRLTVATILRAPGRLARRLASSGLHPEQPYWEQPQPWTAWSPVKDGHGSDDPDELEAGR
jgi:hypothetical protein